MCQFLSRPNTCSTPFSFLTSNNRLAYLAGEISRQEVTKVGVEKASVIFKEISTTEEKPRQCIRMTRKLPCRKNKTKQKLHIRARRIVQCHLCGVAYGGTRDIPLRKSWNLTEISESS